MRIGYDYECISVDMYFEREQKFFIEDICRRIRKSLEDKAFELGERTGGEGTLEDIWFYAEIACNELQEEKMNHIRRISESEKEELEKRWQDFKADAISNAPTYMLYFGNGVHVICSREEMNKHIMDTLNRIADTLENMSPLETFFYNMSFRKKAPTVKYGWMMLVPIMLFEGFFYVRIHLWLLTLAIFYAWRKNEIKKFNGGKY